MANLRYVTLTGAGEKTSFAAMKRLASTYPFVEWGVLYSPDRAGKEGRYPSLEWLEAFADKANQAGMAIALHLCGSSVRSLLDEAPRHGLWSASASEPVRRLYSLAQQFGRVQLNTRAKSQDFPGFKALINQVTRSEHRTRVILQWNTHNEDACQQLAHEQGFEVLVDSSGGRGVERTEWPALDRTTFRRVGFAGGLGPENIKAQLDTLVQVSPDYAFWVDMEGKLRDEADQLDLSRCEAVLEQATEFIREREQEAGALHGTGYRKTDTLKGLWLDWWVAEAQGLNTVIPPVGASKTVLLERSTGSYIGYEPSESDHLSVRLFGEEQIALLPVTSGRWEAYPLAEPTMRVSGSTLVEAGLRAIVLKHFGDKVPRNPTATAR